MTNYGGMFLEIIVDGGNKAVREKLILQLAEAGFKWVTVVQLRAFVSPSVVFGAGLLKWQVSLWVPNRPTGCGCHDDCGAMVDHQVTVEDFGFGRERQHGLQNGAGAKSMYAGWGNAWL
jgi:hypothetical protein